MHVPTYNHVLDSCDCTSNELAPFLKPTRLNLGVYIKSFAEPDIVNLIV